MVKSLHFETKKCQKNSIEYAQPRSQALSSPERKTLVGSGHVAPRFWVVSNKIIEHVRLFLRKHNIFFSTLG